MHQKHLTIHIIAFLLIFCLSYSNDSFSKLNPNSKIYTSYLSYLQTPLGLNTKASESISAYQIAQKIQQDFYHLINLGSQLSYHSNIITLSQKDTIQIEDLILLLDKEFVLLNEEPDELIAKLLVDESIPKNPITSSSEKKDVFAFKSTSIHQKSSNLSNQINTELDFDYIKNNEIKGDIKLSTSSSKLQNRSLQRSRNKAELDIEELSVTWKPKTSIKQVQAGKYKQHIGLGLAQSSTVEGVELEKLYHDYQIKLGYHDGLFASLTTPHILDIPFTFYSIQRNNKQNNLSNATHSGLYFDKAYKSFQVRSEISEYQDHGKFNGYGAANKDSAFSMSVHYKAHKKVTFGSSITHLGQNFNNRHKNTNLHDFDQANNQSLQKELYYSLSGYFGNTLSSVSGISDFKLNMDLNIDHKNKVSLVYDQIYDHSNDRRNRNNELGLTTLYLTHKTKSDYTFQLSMQHIDFLSSGVANQGFLQSQTRADGSLFRSSVQYSF
ncbi:MAG: hypothetical protein KC646_18015 [Candidatus Cloacimonetes bacterium]|nr:hypothetical protein [Candidatus Cloacimonadota bacterium]